MRSRSIRLLRGGAVTVATVLAFGSLSPAPVAGAARTPSTALVRTVERDGGCRAGPGEWDLEVHRARRGRLHIEFRVREVGQAQRWQVFVADNGRRVAAVTRFTGDVGEFRVRKRTRNRSGRDRISASAVNPRTGSTCTARMRY